MRKGRIIKALAHNKTPDIEGGKVYYDVDTLSCIVFSYHSTLYTQINFHGIILPLKKLFF